MASAGRASLHRRRPLPAEGAVVVISATAGQRGAARRRIRLAPRATYARRGGALLRPPPHGRGRERPGRARAANRRRAPWGGAPLERGIPTAAPTLDLRDREPADPTIGSAASPALR